VFAPSLDEHRARWRGAWTSLFGAPAHGAARRDGADGSGSVASAGSGVVVPYSDAELDAAFADFPVVSRDTARIMAHAAAVSSTVKRGYADPRPEIAPMRMAARWRGGGETSAGRNQGVGAEQHYQSHLRADLYRDRPPADAKAPSDTVPSYAYRHAATMSRGESRGNVYDRLLDPRGFTGAHRHRFDASGRGLGLRGRDSADVDYELTVGRIDTDTIPAPMPATVRPGRSLAAR
jgi:hypothetical protein